MLEDCDIVDVMLHVPQANIHCAWSTNVEI
jgi:hypothetical protein